MIKNAKAFDPVALDDITLRAYVCKIREKAAKLEREREQLAKELAHAKTDRRTIGTISGQGRFWMQFTAASQIQEVAEERLHQIFGHLRKMTPGDHHVESSRGLSGLRIAEASSYADIQKVDVRVTMSGGPKGVRPDFDVYFLNRYGFVTGRLGESWAINRLKPNEVRSEDHKVAMRFGPPAYWFVNPVESHHRMPTVPESPDAP